jgi:hypothetical protein
LSGETLRQARLLSRATVVEKTLGFRNCLQTRDGQSSPGPGLVGIGTKFLFLTGTKIFLTRTSTKIFAEQDQDQNVFFGPGP